MAKVLGLKIQKDMSGLLNLSGCLVYITVCEWLYLCQSFPCCGWCSACKTLRQTSSKALQDDCGTDGVLVVPDKSRKKVKIGTRSLQNPVCMFPISLLI